MSLPQRGGGDWPCQGTCCCEERHLISLPTQPDCHSLPLRKNMLQDELTFGTGRKVDWTITVHSRTRSIPRPGEFQKPSDKKRTTRTLSTQSIRRKPRCDQMQGCCFL
ncbi:hypothetical protein R3I94_021790 [Phoxinus phoxinus]